MTSRIPDNGAERPEDATGSRGNRPTETSEGSGERTSGNTGSSQKGHPGSYWFNIIIYAFVTIVASVVAGFVLYYFLPPDEGSSSSPASRIPSPPNVQICDVLADPPGPEPDEERIVLCNYEEQRVLLGGWTLKDNHGQYLIPVGEEIEPQGRWLVEGRTYNPTRSRTGSMFLANRSDFVALYDPAGTEVDRFAW